mgnify:FL=1
MNEIAPWLILFLPLISAAVITLFTQKNRGLSAGISIAAIVASFVLSAMLFFQLSGHEGKTEFAFNWLSIGDLQIDFGLRFDSLSLLMLLIVTGVGSAIHIYS